MKPSCLLRLDPEVFGSETVCHGAHIAAVVDAIGRVRSDLVWYAADVQAVGPPIVKDLRPTPELVGDTAAFALAAKAVSQFDSGVFVGVPARCSDPRFRDGGLWTEDEDAADLADALVELRAFDTSYILVATSDVDLAERIAEELGGVWVQDGSRHPELFQLFAGYFHEDWPVDSASADEVIDMFLGVHPRSELAHLAGLIDAFTAEAPDDESLKHALFQELGCYYAPEADGHTVRSWLQHVSSRLRAAA